ncbi:hypothetical protein N7488_007893 [Penicillium malachiteum]|nr:hypothetical protein N7488_007893 [Penicillium malachiteum]
MEDHCSGYEWKGADSDGCMDLTGKKILFFDSQKRGPTSKRSVRSEGHDEEDDVVHWAMLLHHRGKDGQIYHVHYTDGHYEKYGPALEKDTGQLHVVGQSSKHHGYLAADENITKVLVRKNESGGLDGFCATMSNGDQWGFLDKNGDHDSDEDSESATAQEHEEQHKRGKSVFTLEPAEDEVIVGFYGRSGSKSGFIHRPGILTAPRDVELPETVYDLPEFNNRLKFGLENAHFYSLGHCAWSTFGLFLRISSRDPFISN